MLVYNLLNSWSQEKFEQHIHKIQAFYRDRRDVLIGTLNKHLAGTQQQSYALSVWAIKQQKLTCSLEKNQIFCFYSLTEEPYEIN